MSKCLLFVAIWSFSGSLCAQTLHYWGEAKSPDGKTVYKESHDIFKKDGQLLKTVTTYYEPDGKTKLAELTSAYSANVKLPTYEFVDYRQNYREGLRKEGANYVVFKQDGKASEKSKVLAKTDELFAGQGWHFYLADNLQVLEKDDFKLEMLLPSELDSFEFVMKKSEKKGGKIFTTLQLSNWFLSMFAPKLKLVYDSDSKRLVEYRGVSNILDEKGERQEVEIRYRY